MKKRFRSTLSLFLAILLVISCAAGAVANAALLGDVDGSGRVNSSDARLALRAAARMETLNAEQFAAADVDGSGKVNSADARRILRAAARIEPLPTQEPTAPTTEPAQPSTEPSQPSTEPTVPAVAPDPPRGQKYEWRLAGSRTQIAEDPGGDIAYSYSAAKNNHYVSMRQKSTGTFAKFRSTCSDPPAAVEPGIRIVMDLTLEIEQTDSDYQGGNFASSARLRQDAPDLPFGGASQNAVSFVAAQAGGKNQCALTCGGAAASDSAQVYTVFPRAAVGQRISIYFTACESETVWTYVSQLVSGEPASVTEPVPGAEQPVDPSTQPTSPTEPPANGETLRTPVTGSELQKYQNAADYEISELYRYTKGGAEHVILDDYETVEFDISGIPADERQDYLGFYLNEETGEPFWLIPDPEARLEGKLRFETLHYSLFGWGKPTENDLIVTWADRAAAQGVTQRIAEEDITPGLKDMVDDTLKAGGLGKDQYGGAIVRFILSQDAKGELLAAAADGDMESVKKIVANGTAEYLIGKVLTGEDDSVLYSGGVDNAELLKKRVKEGDPSATLEIVKNIESNMFSAVSYTQKFAALVDKLADIWTDDMMNEQYAQFEKMMLNEGRVTGDDWNAIYMKLHGAAVRLQSRGVTAAELRAKFDQRFANNEKIKKESASLLRYIAKWRADGLLNDLYWFGHPSEIEMLNSLRQQREMIREMLTINGKFKRGKNYNSDEVFLNDALFNWIHYAKSGKSGFYDWLRQEGVITDKTDVPVPPTGVSALPDSFFGKWSTVVHEEQEGWVDFEAGVIHDGWSTDTYFAAEIKRNAEGQIVVTRTLRDASDTSGGEYSVTLADGNYSFSGNTLTVNDPSGNGRAFWLRLMLGSDGQMTMTEQYLDDTSGTHTLTKE